MEKKKYLTPFGVLVAIALPFLIKVNNKNTCVNYFDYILINFNGNCHYNPDVDLTVPEIIQKYVGNVQTYNVTTKDGYILTMFRIPREKPRGVVLLQPPISAGAIAWLSDGLNSLGVTLWNKGYDVWLSNHRGASYSRNHINMTDKNPLFWDYSFHEIALYDLDAQFEVINQETNSQVIFIGYSMSSTLGLTYASLQPELSKKYVKSYILVAPVVLMENFSSLFKFLFYAMYPLESFFRIGEFMTFEAVRWFGSFVNVAPAVVNFVTSLVMGWTIDEMDPVLYPYIFAHHGRGITNKMLYHYGQIFFNQSHFLMYDYGTESNRVVYGSNLPPSYPLQNIDSSMYFIYGDNDKLATPADVKNLYDLLPQGQVRGKYKIENHNHIDYFFSKYRRNKTYKSIYNILENLEEL
ncbi:lipase lipl-4-like [Zophobas morio]|uniref:lipase lipl-4-like n=1 Tax=Zophobas morio TaxID=2755281 RepID=UPI0030835C6A